MREDGFVRADADQEVYAGEGELALTELEGMSAEPTGEGMISELAPRKITRC